MNDAECPCNGGLTVVRRRGSGYFFCNNVKCSLAFRVYRCFGKPVDHDLKEETEQYVLSEMRRLLIKTEEPEASKRPFDYTGLICGILIVGMFLLATYLEVTR